METGKVIEAAIAYFENDIRRISHLLKVIIGLLEFV